MAKYLPPTQDIYERAISAWRKTLAEWEEADHRAIEAVKKQRRNDGVGEGNLIAYCESKLEIAARLTKPFLKPPYNGTDSIQTNQKPPAQYNKEVRDE